MKTVLLSEGDPTSINLELLELSLPRLRAWSQDTQFLLVRGNHNLHLDAFAPVEGLPAGPGLYSYTLPTKKTNGLRLGKPTAQSGRIAYDCLVQAMKFQKQTRAPLITLPLSKEWVLKSGVTNFRGHTETLAKFFKRPTFMLMSGKTWNVIPLTTHIPLRAVVRELKRFPWKELGQALLTAGYKKATRIAYLGLNPHAGEGGQIGKEETTILLPGVRELRKLGFLVEGPFAADSCFLPNQRVYDLYLSPTHDQGLIPFKLLEGKQGINVTLGLEYPRVSPDHGTAFGIAGKGLADPTGLLSCLEYVLGGNPWNY